MEAATVAFDSIDIFNPDRYARQGYPHREWALLRRHAPVYRYERPNVEPFWAVTRHADIVAISRQPRLYNNGLIPQVIPRESQITEAETIPFRTLLQMNPPEHGRYRGLTSPRFTPRAIRLLEGRMRAIAREVVDRAASRALDGVLEARQCDFVVDVAARLPLAAIGEMLGVPHEDWEPLLRWANEVIGAPDPEFRRGRRTSETVDQARLELFDYFARLAAERRRAPRGDLTSAIATARLDGDLLPVKEMLSYFFLLVVAGDETTRNATAGGLLAFIEHPEQWQRLRREPALMRSAVEEVLRWTSPLIQFRRVAAAESALRGQRICRGDVLALFYPSANRDEEVFADPDRFDIARQPNAHLAFGIGEHFCLGAHLARLELEAIFGQLVLRLEEVELAGPVQRLRSTFVGGIKHMPIRYRLKPAESA